jgi:integrase
MSTIYRRGSKLYVGFKNSAGKWQYAATGLNAGQEREAKKLLGKIAVKIDVAERFNEATEGPITVRRFAEGWLKDRERLGIRDVPTDRGRMEHHVYPSLGDVPLADVRPRHLIALIRELRTKGKIAPRTIHNVYGLLHTLFRDAVIEEILDATPCVLGKTQLGKKEDKNPEWRAQAIFTRDELEMLISTEEVPWDRRVSYALQGIAGLRHGEVAGLCWRHLDTSAKPLARLVVARSYGRASTKTSRTREVPVHPTLAAILDAWKLGGWVELMGRQPTPDDALLPSREGRIRSRHHSRNKLLEDLARLGLRHRRGHDLRRTFVTLCRVDGARKDILEMISHNPRGNIVDIYTSMPWPSLCEEVAKLKVERRKGAAIPTPETPQVREKTSALTTVLTTVTPPALSLVSKSWKSHANSRASFVEAPGVENVRQPRYFGGLHTLPRAFRDFC